VSERNIVGFLQDDEGTWVAELSCGHRRHVRHRPPFEVRPWVLDEAGRSSHLGSWIDCGLCADGPEGGELVCYAELVCPECGTVIDDTHRTH
jgi:tellurite methyltransferase